VYLTGNNVTSAAAQLVQAHFRGLGGMAIF
jgi:hypothetical protein